MELVNTLTLHNVLFSAITLLVNLTKVVHYFHRCGVYPFSLALANIQVHQNCVSG